MSLSTGALNIITAVRYDIDLINAINRMTFIFDPNWQGIDNTLPISFFFVKDFKEVMESEVSQKPLLFYNSQTETNKDMVSGGLLGIVSDNIVAKPKKYQMSIIIPRSIDIYMKQMMFNKRVSFADLYNNQALSGLDATVALSFDMLTNIIRALNSTPLTTWLDTHDLRQFISDSLTSGIDDSNKTSLDAMWNNRTLLRMKYWNGWKFKYVAIESYIPSKAGEEDNFFEATLNLTEVPILTTRKSGGVSIMKNSSKLSRLVNTKNITKLLDSLEDGSVL